MAEKPQIDIRKRGLAVLQRAVELVETQLEAAAEHNPGLASSAANLARALTALAAEDRKAGESAIKAKESEERIRALALRNQVLAKSVDEGLTEAERWEALKAYVVALPKARRAEIRELVSR